MSGRSKVSGRTRGKLDNSSFGRGSVDKNATGDGKILNLSLSPNAMVKNRMPPAITAEPVYEGGGQLTEVSEEIVDIYGHNSLNTRSSKGGNSSQYNSYNNSKSS